MIKATLYFDNVHFADRRGTPYFDSARDFDNGEAALYFDNVHFAGGMRNG